MDFDVYPSPQINPLPLPAGTESSRIPFVEHTGPGLFGSTGIIFPDTMLIRVAILGPTVPLASNKLIVKLRAIDPSPGPLTPVDNDVTSSALPGAEIFDGTNPTIAANAIISDEGNNVYLIRVYVHILNRDWEIRFENTDTNKYELTWVVADTDEDSHQPWIHIQENIDFDSLGGAFLTNQTFPPPPGLQPVQEINVQNKGTGPLRITDSLATIGTSDFEIISVPTGACSTPDDPTLGICPGGSGILGIKFNPPLAPGLSTTDFTISSDDTTAVSGVPGALHNKRISLSASSSRLEVVLLLDASGSMAWKPDATSVTDPMSIDPTERSRWDELKSAANQFLDLLEYFGGGMGRFAVAMFPNITTGVVPAPVPSSSPLRIPPPAGGDTQDTEIDGTSIANAKAALDSDTPVEFGGGTSMGHGIGLAMGQTAGSFGYFQGPGDAVDFNIRWLVCMSDGKENSFPPRANDFFKTTEGLSLEIGNAGLGESFMEKKIKVFSIGYGIPGGMFHADHDLLKTLTLKSNVTVGEGYRNANASDPMALRKAFRSVIENSLYVSPIVDPGGELTPSTRRAVHYVTITPHDTQVAFVFDWASFQRDRLDVTLITPRCETITSYDAQNNERLGYYEHERYKIFTADYEYLHDVQSDRQGQPRTGLWTLIISGNDLTREETEKYSFDVITRSSLLLTLRFAKAQYFAGDKIELAASLTVNGRPITGAGVALRTKAPGQSADNWLARAQVSKDDDEFQRAAEQLDGEDVDAVGIKTQATILKGLAFNVFENSATGPMPFDSEIEAYTAKFQNTSTPGTYEFYVTATGQTEDAIPFTREKLVTLHLAVHPEPEFTLIDIDYHRASTELLLADIIVRLADRFMNLILLDPEIDVSIVLATDQGEFTGPLIGNLDGTYSRSIQFAAGSEPSIGLQFRGEEIIQPTRVVQVGRLHYVDVVIDYREGAEAQQDSNRHDDPSAALGDVVATDDVTFVSLGAFGSITLGIRDHKILSQANDEDDVTVFAARDQGLRSYLVEALPAGGQANWIELGRSAGITQSFGLRKAGIGSARAVRVTDTSGQTIDSEGLPLSSPGVSIRGVGVKSVGPESKGCWDSILQLLGLGSRR